MNFTKSIEKMQVILAGDYGQHKSEVGLLQDQVLKW
jgi:hypothetical protein